MASTTSPEASEIRRRGRRRLLGAVTLVLLAVVFIPMILDNEPRPQRAEPSLTIPPKENASPLPAPTPPAKAPQAAAPSSSLTPQGVAGRGPEASPATPEPAPAKVQPPAPAAKLEPVAKPEPAVAPKTAPPALNAPPKLEGFAVQVGAFRDEARLQQARAKLEAAGIVHYTERIDASGGAMTRLRAGPFPTREAAEKARAKLQAGQVVPLP